MTTVVLLAAGQSRRFGADCKLQAIHKGRPLVRHAADAIVQTGFPAIAVVADDAVARLLPEFRIVRSSGLQSQSLQAGLEAVTSDRAMIVLGDMPEIDADLLRQIADAPAPSMLTDGERICPPTCIPRSRFAALMNLTGDNGAGKVLRSLPGLHTIRVPPRILKDVDFQEDII